MDKSGEYSSLKPKGKPKTPVQQPVQPQMGEGTKDPGWWESFKGGLQNPDLTYEQWEDLRLTPLEWEKKYPGRKYREWRRTLPKKQLNWFQRVLYPKGLRRHIVRNRLNY